jgi:hypothetical protein
MKSLLTAALMKYGSDIQLKEKQKEILCMFIKAMTV